MNKEAARKRTCPIMDRTCIADACMLWKWSYTYDFNENWRKPAIIRISKTDGYCGLTKND